MKQASCRVEVVLDETWLDLDQLCRMTGVSEVWVCQRMEAGLLAPVVPNPGEPPHFHASDLQRVRRMSSLERDFDAVPELASLVAELEQALAVARERLRRLEG